MELASLPSYNTSLWCSAKWISLSDLNLNVLWKKTKWGRRQRWRQRLREWEWVALSCTCTLSVSLGYYLLIITWLKNIHWRMKNDKINVFCISNHTFLEVRISSLTLGTLESVNILKKHVLHWLKAILCISIILKRCNQQHRPTVCLPFSDTWNCFQHWKANVFCFFYYSKNTFFASVQNNKFVSKHEVKLSLSIVCYCLGKTTFKVQENNKAWQTIKKRIHLSLTLQTFKWLISFLFYFEHLSFPLCWHGPLMKMFDSY